MRRAEVAQARVRLRLQPLFQRKRDVRFADAGVAGQHHDAPFALSRTLPPAQQQIDLLVAPEQRCRLRFVLRFEPALHLARSQNLPSWDGLLPTFERDGAAIAVLELPGS